MMPMDARRTVLENFLAMTNACGTPHPLIRRFNGKSAMLLSSTTSTVELHIRYELSCSKVSERLLKQRRPSQEYI